MYFADKDNWYLERVIWLVAGIAVLTGSTLSIIVNPYWILLTLFAGINLIIFSFTGFCIMANILVKAGFKPRCD
jgi:hypothetical protein